MDVWGKDHGSNDTDAYFDASSNLDASPDLEPGSNFDDAYWSHDVEQNPGMEVDIKGNEYHNTNASGSATMHNGNSFHTTNNYYAKRIFKTSGHDPVLSMPQIDSVLPTYVWMQSKSSEEKNKLLIDAVSQGQTSRAEALISVGADVDCRVEKSAHELRRKFDSNGKLVRSVDEQNQASGRVSFNALHIAVLNGDLHSTNMLLKYGADIFAQVDLECLSGSSSNCAPSFTVLRLALASSFYESIPSLLKRGAPKEIGIISHAIREMVPLNLLESIVAAGGSFEDSTDSDFGARPLLEALIHAENHPNYCEAVVRFLLSKGADPNLTAPRTIRILYESKFEITIKPGTTVLMIAVSKRLPEITKVLLQHGADVNQEDSTGRTVLTCLYEVCAELYAYRRQPPCAPQQQSKSDKILDMLLSSGSNFQHRNAAVMSGCCEVRHLRRYYAAGVQVSWEKLPMPVLSAYVGGYIPWNQTGKSAGAYEAVIGILETVGGLEDVDDYGATALIHAARHGFVDIIKILLDWGANIEAKDNQGLTALAHAAKKPLKRNVRLLLERGASLDTESMWPKRINDNITRIRLGRPLEVPFSRRSTSSRPFDFSEGADRCSATPSVWTDISSRAETPYSFCDESPEPEQSLKVETPDVFTTGTPSMGRIVEADDEDEDMADIKEESD